MIRRLKLAKLLEGKIIAEAIKNKLKLDIEASGLKPKLASIQVGESHSTEVYMNSQMRTAKFVGAECQFHKLNQNISQEDLIAFIQTLNIDKSINGIIIQMPLPAHIDTKTVSQNINPVKDIEGVHPLNIGQLVLGKTRIFPCTASAAVELIFSTGVNLEGKEIVVVGHSAIVGKPISLLLMDKLATVTTCNLGTSKAGKLEEHVRKADVLVVAVGKAGLIKGDWIKSGAIVIDVGINKLEDKIVGDVEFEVAKEKADFITPVPGGVGPLTVTMLIRNLLEATLAQK